MKKLMMIAISIVSISFLAACGMDSSMTMGKTTQYGAFQECLADCYDMTKKRTKAQQDACVKKCRTDVVGDVDMDPIDTTGTGTSGSGTSDASDSSSTGQ